MTGDARPSPDPRLAVRCARAALPPVAAVALSLAAGALFLAAIGRPPLAVYATMLSATLGSGYGLGQVLFKATPLVFTGLSVSFAFRAGLFNIGAEGQLYVGAFLMALAGLALPASVPAPAAVALCVLAGAAGGVAYGGIPGLLKARLGVHEVIVTIMMNFLAFIFVNHFLLSGLAEHETVHTAAVAEAAQLPRLGAFLPLFRGSAANVTFFGALAAAGAVWFVQARTGLGFRLRAVGHSPRAAATAGIGVSAHLFGAMAIAGGLAALAGANYVLGYKHYFEQGFTAGVGFMGIAVALLGRNHPLGVVAAALLFGLLSEGGLGLGNEVPKELVDVLQAVIILFMVSAQELGRRLSERSAVPAAARGGGGP